MLAMPRWSGIYQRALDTDTSVMPYMIGVCSWLQYPAGEGWVVGGERCNSSLVGLFVAQ
jgi:hypothetical protein